MSNKIISGDYMGCELFDTNQTVCIKNGYSNKAINRRMVESYLVVDQKTSKSLSSTISRSALGVFVLGSVGILAGLTAKSKGVHTIAIQFKDGKKCMLELDDKYYKLLISSLF